MDFEFFERDVREKEMEENEAKWKNGPFRRTTEEDAILRYNYSMIVQLLEKYSYSLLAYQSRIAKHQTLIPWHCR